MTLLPLERNTATALHVDMTKTTNKEHTEKCSQTKWYSTCQTHLVTAQNDRDVLAHPREVSVPVGHVLVRDAARNVEHDDRALPLNAALEEDI